MIEICFAPPMAKSRACINGSSFENAILPREVKNPCMQEWFVYAPFPLLTYHQCSTKYLLTQPYTLERKGFNPAIG